MSGIIAKGTALVMIAEEGSVWKRIFNLDAQTLFDTAVMLVAMLALFANIVCISVIIKKSIQLGKNPYTNDIWMGTKDYEEAMARAE